MSYSFCTGFSINNSVSRLDIGVKCFILYALVERPTGQKVRRRYEVKVAHSTWEFKRNEMVLKDDSSTSMQRQIGKTGKKRKTGL